MKTIQRTIGLFIILFSVLVSPIQAKENSSSSWMESIAKDTKLSELSIPGTHDSATQYVSLSPIFQCQDADIQTQLENGYCYLDIRLVLKKDNLILKHNFAKCRKNKSIFSKPLTLDDVLNDIYTFLDEHPSETIIFCVKKENSKDDLNQVKSIFNSKINTDSWYTENRIPTLNEVRGKIGYPKKNAKKINNHLMEYNWQKKNYGIIIIDFANQELAHKIYSTN